MIRNRRVRNRDDGTIHVTKSRMYLSMSIDNFKAVAFSMWICAMGFVIIFGNLAQSMSEIVRDQTNTWVKLILLLLVPFFFTILTMRCLGCFICTFKDEPESDEEQEEDGNGGTV